MGEWLRDKLPARVDVDALLTGERLVYQDGSVLDADDPYRPHTFVWFHRDLRDEAVVPGTIEVLHRDEHLVVVDKPPFLATIPRGQHVAQSVVVRLRRELGLPELTPAHRLDRVTSGVLVLVTERRWRGAYQQLFARREVTKTYRALVPHRPEVDVPPVIRNHIRKDRGALRALVVPGGPVNAETRLELESSAPDGDVIRLRPLTGRTHQLRLHLSGIGLPIVDDPLYPDVRDVAVDDFSRPLQLLAAELAFVDPLDGSERLFRSGRRLPLRPTDGAGPGVRPAASVG